MATPQSTTPNSRARSIPFVVALAAAVHTLAVARGDLPTGLIAIPSGESVMGDTFNEGGADEKPLHAVYVGPYFIDRYCVTNEQYAEGLNMAQAQGLITILNGIVYKANSGVAFPYCHTTSSTSPNQITWNGSTFGAVAGRENYPMILVSWYGAAAYTNWRSQLEGRVPCYDTGPWSCSFSANGYRLPTEAEWERAARGGAAGHRFPWADTNEIRHARANYYSSSSFLYDTSLTRGYHPDYDDDGLPYTSPVGVFAPNAYGLYDMAGNVMQWCNDWYTNVYYASSPYEDPRGPASGTLRAVRGGSWSVGASISRCADRFGDDPTHRSDETGFRVAMRRIPPDLDGDGDVDIADFGAFLSCFNGPGRPPAQPNCDGSDFDGDGDVDLADFGAFLSCFNGPNRPPACP